jgi:replicative DNA helicase
VTGLRLELEQDVLGAILAAAALDRDAGWRLLDRARELVEPGDFERPSHGALFALLGDMRDRGDPVDAVAVTVELEQLTEQRLEGLAGLVGAIIDPVWILGSLRALQVAAPPTGVLEHRCRLLRAAFDDREPQPC